MLLTQLPRVQICLVCEQYKDRNPNANAVSGKGLSLVLQRITLAGLPEQYPA